MAAKKIQLFLSFLHPLLSLNPDHTFSSFPPPFSKLTETPPQNKNAPHPVPKMNPSRTKKKQTEKKQANFAKAATTAAAATTLLSAGNALAAQSVVAEVAAASGDGRGAILASLALPALGWVAFNMAVRSFFLKSPSRSREGDEERRKRFFFFWIRK